MNGSAKCLLLAFCCLFQLDLALSEPVIRPDSNENYNPLPDEAGFTFNDTEEVIVICEDDTRWEPVWGPVSIIEGNPALPDASYKNITSGDTYKTVVTGNECVDVTSEVPCLDDQDVTCKNVTSQTVCTNVTTQVKDSIWLKIEYVADQYVKLLKVRCSDNYMDSNSALIELRYSTTNVKILTPNMTIDANQKVELECIADGNPDPEYEWFTYDSSGQIIPVDGGKNTSIEVITPDWQSSRQLLYQCRARNRGPDSWISSEWMSVTSSYVPPPVITFLQDPDTKNDSHRIYTNQTLLNLNCTLKSPDDKLEVKINYEVIDGNPVFPEVSPDFSLTESPEAQILQIDYNPEIFVSSVRVSCFARNRMTREIKSSSDVVIEQKYATQNVIIEGPKIIQVESGSNVTLSCLADGNPEPSYVWYKDSSSLDGQSNSELVIAKQEEWGKIDYACGASNGNSVKRSPHVTVVFTGVPTPTIKGVFPPPVKSTSDTLIYHEASQVKLSCGIPYEYEVAVDLNLKVDITQKNPLFPTHELKQYKSQIKYEEAHFELRYDADHFIPFVNVTCEAVTRSNNGTQLKSFSPTLQLEQQYSTKNVKILGQPNVDLEPDSNVTLKCLADGNPTPQYQWYRRTEMGDAKVDNANETDLVVHVPKEKSTEEIYFCGAKNEFMGEELYSDVVKVTATYVIPPIIEPIAQKNTTNGTLTYYWESYLKMICYLPPPIIRGIELKMILEVIERNPVFPDTKIDLLVIENGVQNMEIELEYNSDQMVPVVKVSCQILNSTTKKIKTASAIQIQQRYPTHNVKIEGPSVVKVDKGKSVQLKCLADGNPAPKYKWSLQKDGIEISGENSNILNLTMETDKYNENKYTCKARNRNNPYFRTSPPVTVYGNYYSPSYGFITTPKRTNSSTFMFHEERKVQLICSIPPSELNTEIDVQYERLEDNPVFPIQEVKLVVHEMIRNSVQIDVEYDTEKWVPHIQISCQFRDTTSGVIAGKSEINIEQQYKTKNAVIQVYPSNEVHPNQKVKLTCIADGNPRPSYQWYKGGDAITGADKVEYEFTTEAIGESEYSCAAWNEHNDAQLKSSVTKVSVTPYPRSSPNKAASYQLNWLLFVTLLIMGLAGTLNI